MHFVIIPTQYDEHGDLGRLMPAETTEQIEAIEQVMREDGLQELTVYSGSSDDLDDEQDVVETQLRIVVRLSLIHISEPRDLSTSRMPSSA